MSRRKWFEVHGTGNYKDVLLCRVNSYGLAVLIANFLRLHYTNVHIV